MRVALKCIQNTTVVAERFFRTLKNKIFKCLTALSKHVYIDKLDKIVDNETKNVTKQSE